MKRRHSHETVRFVVQCKRETMNWYKTVGRRTKTSAALNAGAVLDASADQEREGFEEEEA